MPLQTPQLNSFNLNALEFGAKSAKKAKKKPSRENVKRDCPGGVCQVNGANQSSGCGNVIAAVGMVGGILGLASLASLAGSVLGTAFRILTLPFRLVFGGFSSPTSSPLPVANRGENEAPKQRYKIANQAPLIRVADFMSTKDKTVAQVKSALASLSKAEKAKLPKGFRVAIGPSLGYFFDKLLGKRPDQHPNPLTYFDKASKTLFVGKFTPPSIWDHVRPPQQNSATNIRMYLDFNVLGKKVTDSATEAFRRYSKQFRERIR